MRYVTGASDEPFPQAQTDSALLKSDSVYFPSCVSSSHEVTLAIDSPSYIGSAIALSSTIGDFTHETFTEDWAHVGIVSSSLNQQTHQQYVDMPCAISPLAAHSPLAPAFSTPISTANNHPRSKSLSHGPVSLFSPGSTQSTVTIQSGSRASDLNSAAHASINHDVTISRSCSSFTPKSSACLNCLDLNKKIDCLMQVIEELNENQRRLLQSVNNVMNVKSTDEFDLDEFSLPVDSAEDVDQLSVVLSDNTKRRFLVCTMYLYHIFYINCTILANIKYVLCLRLLSKFLTTLYTFLLCHILSRVAVFESVWDRLESHFL